MGHKTSLHQPFLIPSLIPPIPPPFLIPFSHSFPFLSQIHSFSPFLIPFSPSKAPPWHSQGTAPRPGSVCTPQKCPGILRLPTEPRGQQKNLPQARAVPRGLKTRILQDKQGQSSFPALIALFPLFHSNLPGKRSLGQPTRVGQPLGGSRGRRDPGVPCAPMGAPCSPPCAPRGSVCFGWDTPGWGDST